LGLWLKYLTTEIFILPCTISKNVYLNTLLLNFDFGTTPFDGELVDTCGNDPITSPLFMVLEHQFISNQSERNYYELDELRFWDLFLGGA
jgi:hypothetical protein